MSDVVNIKRPGLTTSIRRLSINWNGDELEIVGVPDFNISSDLEDEDEEGDNNTTLNGDTNKSIDINHNISLPTDKDGNDEHVKLLQMNSVVEEKVDEETGMTDAVLIKPKIRCSESDMKSLSQCTSKELYINKSVRTMSTLTTSSTTTARTTSVNMAVNIQAANREDQRGQQFENNLTYRQSSTYLMDMELPPPDPDSVAKLLEKNGEIIQNDIESQNMTFLAFKKIATAKPDTDCVAKLLEKKGPIIQNDIYSHNMTLQQRVIAFKEYETANSVAPVNMVVICVDDDDIKEDETLEEQEINMDLEEETAEDIQNHLEKLKYYKKEHRTSFSPSLIMIDNEIQHMLDDCSYNENDNYKHIPKEDEITKIVKEVIRQTKNIGETTVKDQKKIYLDIKTKSIFLYVVIGICLLSIALSVFLNVDYTPEKKNPISTATLEKFAEKIKQVQNQTSTESNKYRNNNNSITR